MISDIIKPENNLNFYFSSLCINDNTLDFFKGQLTVKKINNEILVPGFLFQTLDKIESFHLPLNYTDIDNMDFDSNKYFLLKLEPAASITYIFDSPLEMLYYYQIHHSKLNSEHQFICFFNTINNRSISKILELSRKTKIKTVFNKNNNHGNINDIRFALIKNSIEFEVLRKSKSISITFKNKTYRFPADRILLHEFEKKAKYRTYIKTIKPPKKFNTFQEIFLP